MTDVPSFDSIKLEIADTVATITLNRPDRLNSMPPAMADDIRAALDHLPSLGARALLITGEGRGFCSGADLADDRSGGGAVGGGARSRNALRGHYNPMLLALANLDIPVVVAVNGPAAGVGCSFALSGDFTIAGKSAYFLQAFVNIGLVPDGGSSWLLTKAVGRVRAMEMMLLGERLYGPQALEWGLVNRVVPDDEVESTAMALAKELAKGPRSLGLIKHLAWSAADLTLEEALVHERLHQRDACRTEDFIEGITAFAGKRTPEFKGK